MSDVCEWCEGDGCDECQVALPASTAMTETIPSMNPTATEADPPQIFVECEWCENEGCEECQDQRDAAMAAAIASRAGSTPQQTNTAPIEIFIECEWCENQGCEECQDQRDAAMAAAMAARGNAPTPTPTTTKPAVAASSAQIFSYHNDDDDDDDYGYGNNYNQEEEVMDIPTQIENLWYSCQYAPPAHQLVNLEQIEAFARDGLFPYDQCSVGQLSAFITSLTKLLGVRMSLKHDFDRISVTFDVCVAAHRRCNYQEVLSNEVTDMLSKAELYDAEENKLALGSQLPQPSPSEDGVDGMDGATASPAVPAIPLSARWIEACSAMLTKHKASLPALYVPIVEKKLWILVQQFDRMTGKFAGTEAQSQQLQGEYYNLLEKCDNLNVLCRRKAATNNNNSSIGPNLSTMNDDNDQPTPLPTTQRQQQNSRRRRYGFQAHITNTFVFNTHLPVSNDLDFSPAYSSIMLESLTLKAHIWKALDKTTMVGNLLFSISAILRTTTVSSPALLGRISELFGYYNANKGLWSSAYKAYYLAFTRYNQSGYKVLATNALCLTAISSVLQAATTGATFVNPLVSQEAQIYMESAHMGLSGLSNLIMGFSKIDHKKFQAGLAQWNDYCKMFGNRAGVRFGMELQGVLFQATIKQYSITHSGLHLYELLSHYTLLDPGQFSKDLVVKQMVHSYLNDVAAANNGNSIGNNNNNDDDGNAMNHDLLIQNQFEETSRPFQSALLSFQNELFSTNQPLSLSAVGNLIRSGTIMGSIDDLDNTLTFKQKVPLVVLMTQGAKEQEQIENLQYSCFSNSILDNAIPIIASLPMPGVPLQQNFLYYAHGGTQRRTNTHTNWVIDWQTAKRGKKDQAPTWDNSVTQYIYRYTPYEIHSIVHDMINPGVARVCFTTHLRAQKRMDNRNTTLRRNFALFSKKFNTLIKSMRSVPSGYHSLPSSRQTSKRYTTNNNNNKSTTPQQPTKVVNFNALAVRFTRYMQLFASHNDFVTRNQKKGHNSKASGKEPQIPIFSPSVAFPSDTIATMITTNQNPILHKQFQTQWLNTMLLAQTATAVKRAFSFEPIEFSIAGSLRSLEALRASRRFFTGMMMDMGQYQQQAFTGGHLQRQTSTSGMGRQQSRPTRLNEQDSRTLNNQAQSEYNRQYRK